MSATPMGTPPVVLPKKKNKVVAPAAAVLATGALACGVCCVLPFALPAAALAASGGMLAWLGSAYSWAMVVAGIAVFAAWVWVAVQSMHARRAPARATLIAMSVATSILAAAFGWRYIEPWVLGVLGQ